MADMTRDGLPPATPTDATKTLGALQLKEGRARAAQQERADREAEVKN